MREKEELFMRRLSLTLTTIVGLIALFTIYGSQRYMPNDPFNLRRNLSLYCIFVLLVSIMGFIGAIKRNATLLSTFASHLLLDAILYFIPRLLLLNLSISLPTLMCSSNSPTSLTTAHKNNSGGSSSSSSSSESRSTLAHRVVLSHVRLESSAGCNSPMRMVAQAVIVCGVLLVMLLQVRLALKMRRYAQWLERKEEEEQRQQHQEVVSMTLSPRECVCNDLDAERKPFAARRKEPDEKELC